MTLPFGLTLLAIAAVAHMACAEILPTSDAMPQVLQDVSSFCTSKPYGAYVNSPSPGCLYFCYGTVLSGSLGYTSCCAAGSCFNLPSLAYPLGVCLPCPPPPRCSLAHFTEGVH